MNRSIEARMTSQKWNMPSLPSGLFRARLAIPFFVLLTSVCSSPGDGCFVFRWNKAVDINEPTQKAIIVYDRGREDLLLQVKYQGPLEDFGWLIPVPGLPSVEKGAMEPFYELSQLTQRKFGQVVDTAGAGGRGRAQDEAERVNVLEIKTVGAYEVAILSAGDAGSLVRWLESNGYSVPEGKSAILGEYTAKGWYFVAARIQLDRDVAFKLVSTASPKDSDASTRARQTLQRQMASGELHPLRISFDTPQCIFPLKISAVGGKSSELSLYVLSAEPLLNRFIFDKGVAKLHQQKIEYDSKATQRRQNALVCMQNTRRLGVSWKMFVLLPPAEKGVRPTHDWSLEDLDAIAAEGEQPVPLEEMDDSYYASPTDLLQTMEVAPDKLTKCTKVTREAKRQRLAPGKAGLSLSTRRDAGPRLRARHSRPCRAAAVSGGSNGGGAIVSLRAGRRAGPFVRMQDHKFHGAHQCFRAPSELQGRTPGRNLACPSERSGR